MDGSTATSVEEEAARLCLGRHVRGTPARRCLAGADEHPQHGAAEHPPQRQLEPAQHCHALAAAPAELVLPCQSAHAVAEIGEDWGGRRAWSRPTNRGFRLSHRVRRCEREMDWASCDRCGAANEKWTGPNGLDQLFRAQFKNLPGEAGRTGKTGFRPKIGRKKKSLFVYPDHSSSFDRNF